MLIRNERPADADIIHVLTETAFAPMSYSSGSEAQIIRALRHSGELTLSLVAEIDGGIVGHVAFSPVTIDGDQAHWYGLGPISVDRAYQRRGIGTALVAAGIAELERRGAAGCALIGDPAVYAGMGFGSDGLLTYRNIDTRLVQRLTLAGPPPHGELRFAPAFETGA